MVNLAKAELTKCKGKESLAEALPLACGKNRDAIKPLQKGSCSSFQLQTMNYGSLNSLVAAFVFPFKAMM